MAAIVSEYRKFTEVANVRNHKNTAERRLKDLRANSNRRDNTNSEDDSDNKESSDNNSEITENEVRRVRTKTKKKKPKQTQSKNAKPPADKISA